MVIKINDKIKSRKTINQIFNDFESLKGMVLLFNRNTDYYKFSGMVTAALLDYDDPENKISILAIDTGRSKEWFTFKYGRDDLIKMFNNCAAFVGKTPETSFILDKKDN